MKLDKDYVFTSFVLLYRRNTTKNYVYFDFQ